MPTPLALLLKLFFRLLKHAPHRAEASLLSAYLPCLKGGSAPALAFLADACLLAPRLAPQLLHTVAMTTAYGQRGEGGSQATFLVVDAVAGTLLRLSLEGVNNACIDYAASGVLSTATGPKFSTM